MTEDATDTHGEKYLIQKGQELDQSGRYAEAIEQYDKVLALNALSAEAHMCRGDALAWMFKYEEAIYSYQKAASADSDASNPMRAAAYGKIAELLYIRRRFDEAADSFSKAITLFDKLEKYYRDKTKYGKADDAKAQCSDMHNGLGYTYFELKRYEGAANEFALAIEKGGKYPYAYHSMASLLWSRGKYQEAMKAWREAYYRYDLEARMQEAVGQNWPGHFLNFGNMLHEIFGEFERAEQMYNETLRLAPYSATARINLLNLYLEKTETACERVDSYWRAKATYEETTALLSKRLDTADDLESMLMLGELHLAWKDYDQAKEWLEKACQKDEKDGGVLGYKRTPKPVAGLGVLYARQKKYRKAIACFKEALEIDNDDLSLRSNLAEACLRASQLDEAESEYNRILMVAPQHIESLIGLGELYLALADAGDVDMYDQSVMMFSNALKLAQQKTGSKRLRKKEMATVLYLRAYARVRTFEATKLIRDQRSLFFARDDFRICFKTDPELYHAKRAIEKIDKYMTARSPQRLMEKFGPFIVLLFSSIVFVITQLGFFLDTTKISSLSLFNRANKIDPNHYILLTFGSMLLMIASLYLPQILKLKFVGLELEKSIVDQVATLSTLGISTLSKS